MGEKDGGSDAMLVNELGTETPGSWKMSWRTGIGVPLYFSPSMSRKVDGPLLARLW